MNGQGLVIGGRISVGFIPFEHEEDRAPDLVGDGDDRAFMAEPEDQRLEFCLEDGLGSAGCMSELAKESADIEIAFADPAGLMFAGRLVVAGADADPGRQTVGIAERANGPDSAADSALLSACGLPPGSPARWRCPLPSRTPARCSARSLLATDVVV